MPARARRPSGQSSSTGRRSRCPMLPWTSEVRRTTSRLPLRSPSPRFEGLGGVTIALSWDARHGQAERRVGSPAETPVRERHLQRQDRNAHHEPDVVTTLAAPPTAPRMLGVTPRNVERSARWLVGRRRGRRSSGRHRQGLRRGRSSGRSRRERETKADAVVSATMAEASARSSPSARQGPSREDQGDAEAEAYGRAKSKAR